MLNQDFEIDSRQIPILERRALRGDGIAALRLSRFYDFVTNSNEIARYWELIAAENGNATGQHNTGVSLSESGLQRDHMRAVFWLKKAKASGIIDCNGSRGTKCVSLLQRLESGER
jgi:TPR repeat protein